MSPQPNYADWPTKSEAAVALACNEKTIERLAARGRLQQAFRRVAGRRPAAVYNPVDVNNLVAENRAAQPFVSPPEENTSVVLGDKELPIKTLSGQLAAVAEYLKEPTVPITQKLYLTIDEAMEYTGLTRTYLLREIKRGSVLALKDGGWKIKRESLSDVL